MVRLQRECWRKPKNFMEIEATAKYLRISPKKIKGIAKTIVGISPRKVIDSLMLNGDKAGRLLAKVVKSALANAKNNAKLNELQLKIKTVEVLPGPFFKRWQPVSRGMAHQIKKRTSHIRVTLEEIKEAHGPKN